MEDSEHPEEQPADVVDPVAPRERSSRDELLEQLGIDLLNAGILIPAVDFVTDVRKVAGFRASPRQIAAITQELSHSGQQVNADAVARLVSEMRGYASSRQRRHAEQWRALGSALALRGLDGSPAGQRSFIGRARGTSGQNTSDRLLLEVAVTIAGLGRSLDPTTVGEIGKRLGPSAQVLEPDQIAALIEAELRDLGRERAVVGRPKSRSSSAKRRKPAPGPNLGTRKWRPGGRRRRGRIVLPKPRADQ